jgi:hypothetical protein
MGEIVSPAIAGLRQLGERSRQAGLGKPGVPGQAGLPEAGAELFSGSLRDVAALLPEFERRSFASADRTSGQPHLDLLVRRAGPGVGLLDVPVGTVTRRHRLAPHARVIGAIERPVSAACANPDEARCQLILSALGEGMALSVDLPDRFGFDPGDGEQLRLRLLCLNAVAGCGPRLLLCWHRQISSSLIPVGVTQLQFRLAPRLALRTDEIAPAVDAALDQARAERAGLAAWRQSLLTRDRLVKWADGTIRRVWGPRAAARVFHIAMSGWDAQPAYGFERMPPSRRTMRATEPVPAVQDFAESAYDALLAAAWVAGSGRGACERFDRACEIALLMRALLRGERRR